MLLSVVLYGSRARGDHRSSSDVDLLGLIEQGSIRKEISKGGTSLYHYPAPLLINQAKTGNLFVLHLVSEGIVLHDTLGSFNRIKRQFEFKKSYESEVFEASAIVKFFSSRTKLLSGKGARKRLIWAIRTILIARAAEKGEAIFSSAMLASFSGIKNTKDVIDNRHLDIGNDLSSLSMKVIQKFGSIDPTITGWPIEKEAQRSIMTSIGGIAKDTLRFVRPPVIRKIIESQKLGLIDGELTYPD